jgi:maltooligosyltrehalose trehalohydrolase
MSAHNMPLSHGATLIAPNRTRFQFWAPDVKTIGLEVDGHSPLLMQAEGDGWHRLEVDCGTGTRYRYRISPDLAVPDPVARAQADDVHGPSIVIDPASYAWRSTEWRGRPWREAIFYELHPGALGGFRGVAEHLPRLKALGITAIELMPIADF